MGWPGGLPIGEILFSSAQSEMTAENGNQIAEINHELNAETIALTVQADSMSKPEWKLKQKALNTLFKEIAIGQIKYKEAITYRSESKADIMFIIKYSSTFYYSYIVLALLSMHSR